MPYIHLKPLLDQAKEKHGATDGNAAMDIQIFIIPKWLQSLFHLLGIQYNIRIDVGRVEDDRFIQTQTWGMKK